MADTQRTQRFRFGIFEADAATGELRRQGVRIKLHAQPFQLLFLLLNRPGEVLTREEICRQLWPDGTFVDYEHGVNSAVNRLREALGDKASSPRFIETLARRGYRFLAPVEAVIPFQPSVLAQQPARVAETAAESSTAAAMQPAAQPSAVAPERVTGGGLARLLAGPEDLPASSPVMVRTLFVLLQVMYVAFYVGALSNLGEINELLSPWDYATQIFFGIVATAAVLIPVRAFLVSAVLFRPPRFQERFLKLWPALFLLDIVWALAPFLLLHHIPYGLALACMTLLVYSPFAQRSLILMGAGQTDTLMPSGTV